MLEQCAREAWLLEGKCDRGRMGGAGQGYDLRADGEGGAKGRLAGWERRGDMGLNLIRLGLGVVFRVFGGEGCDDCRGGNHGYEDESDDEVMHGKLHF